jgi:hypothetical protein
MAPGNSRPPSRRTRCSSSFKLLAMHAILAPGCCHALLQAPSNAAGVVGEGGSCPPHSSSSRWHLQSARGAPGCLHQHRGHRNHCASVAVRAGNGNDNGGGHTGGGGKLRSTLSRKPPSHSMAAGKRTRANTSTHWQLMSYCPSS